MEDTRVVCGANCCWWDSIDKVARTRPKGSEHWLPCCPKCGGPLFEYENLEHFMQGSEEFEVNGHPGYIEMLTWARGRCYHTMPELKKAWEERES